MKRILKIVVPVILAILIAFCIGWYFLQYNTTATRDFLLHQARQLEADGKHEMAVWFYDLAYAQSKGSDVVAIELAEQFKAIGNYTKAEYTLSKAIETAPTAELYTALSRTYVEQGKLRDAVNMLNQIQDPDMKALLDGLRPATPVASAESGNYTQYLSVSFTTGDYVLYVSCNGDYPSIKSDLYSGAIRLSGGNTTLFAVAVAENGLVSQLSVYNYVISDVVEEVNFIDSAVEAAVRQLLGVEEGSVIYSSNLWNITEFTVPTEAESCADLLWMRQLQKLTILGGFSDLQLLSNLQQLQSLTIVGSSISQSDLQVIATLPQLQQLTLDSCNLSSIVALSEATGLVSLDLRGNAIRDASALVALPQLQKLCLRGNALINLDDICKIETLTELDVSYNYLISTAPAAALTGLTSLDVSGNGLMKLEGIGQLTALRHFAAAYNNLIDVNILEGCTDLQTLDVSHNTLLNISVLAKLTNLTDLDFSHNEVTSLPKLSKTCSLYTINGAYNSLTSLDALSGLESLTYIYMDYNTSLSNVNSLVKCPVLKELYVYGSRVRDISKLADAGIYVQYTPV